MEYRARKETAETIRLRDALGPVLKGLGFVLVELTVSRSRGSCQARLIVTQAAGEKSLSSIGTEELGRLHRALLPRLELALGDCSVELSSPGIDRVLKEGAEAAFFTGRFLRCYLPERSDWIRGRLAASDEHTIILETEDGELRLRYEDIAKAKLDG
jgi:ribosome maturation factor RimP